MANPPIPDGASSAEVLQGAIRKLYNRRVREWFNDVDVLTELDLNIARHAAYAACKHDDDDSLVQTLARQLLFTEIRNRLSPQLIGTTDKKTTVIRKSKPKITLYFQEQIADIEDGYAPVTGQIGFRLMGEDRSIPESKLKVYANKIKTLFKAESRQLWKKGKIMCSYSDWSNGYQLQLLVRNVSEGKSLTNTVLSIQGHTPEWEHFQVTENEAPTEAFPTLPKNDLVMGKTTRLPRRRPIATVRFQFAIAELEGLTRPVYLVDRSGIASNPLVDW